MTERQKLKIKNNEEVRMRRKRRKGEGKGKVEQQQQLLMDLIKHLSIQQHVTGEHGGIHNSQWTGGYQP